MTEQVERNSLQRPKDRLTRDLRVVPAGQTSREVELYVHPTF